MAAREGEEQDEGEDRQKEMAQAVPTAAGAESGETRVCAPRSPALIPRLATKVCAPLEAAPRLFFFFESCTC